MAIRALIFDLDETLLYEEASVRAALIETSTIAQTQSGIHPEKLADSVITRAREVWRSFPIYSECHALGISSWEGLATSFTGESSLLITLRQLTPAYRAKVWTLALQDHGVSNEQLASELAALFPAIRKEKHIPFPETGSIMAELKKKFRLGMITNGPSEHQREKIAVSGLADFFAAIVISGEVGVGKPDSRIFQHALEKLAAKPGESVMIGDSLGRDILGAKNAGLAAVWINRNGSTRKPADPVPDAIITRLDELPKFLDQRLS